MRETAEYKAQAAADAAERAQSFHAAERFNQVTSASYERWSRSASEATRGYLTGKRPRKKR